MAVPLRVRQFNVQEFHRMTAAGILSEDDHLELIDGEIVEMAPIGPRHASCVIRLTSLLASSLGGQASLSVQNPVQLDALSELYPDLTVLRSQAHQYRDNLPTPSDVLLLIEVSDTTLDADRTIKIPRYSQAGIAEVWLVDLINNLVQVHTDPTPTGYRSTRVLHGRDLLQAIQIPVVQLTVESILP